MPTSFKTILVPADLSINTEVAIRKALEIADGEGAQVHLFHIEKGATKGTPKQPFWSWKRSCSTAVAHQKLEQWKGLIGREAPGLAVHIEIVSCPLPVQKTIGLKAGELSADLVVIGKKSNHTWLPFLNTVIPSEVAQAAGCAVLTVKPGALQNRIKTVVVPVSTEIPGPKLQTIGALCAKHKMKVHLVTFESENNTPADFSASTLLKTYQWLQNALHCQVEYAVLHGSNKAKATLQYAERIGADVLLVHPVTETKTGWFNQHISDVVPAQSKVQVLAI